MSGTETNLSLRETIARLVAKEQALAAREKQLAEELTGVANERKAVQADRETLEKAEAITARVSASEVAPRAQVQAANGNLGATITAVVEAAGQSRARIGPQRYAMLATLRRYERLDVAQLADLTRLSVNRIREQMRADQPYYVLEETLLGNLSGGEPRLYLTDAGVELLRRFEEYRKSQGKPLPPMVSDDAEVDEEVDPAHSKSHEAGVQGPHAQGREAVPGGGT